MNTVTSALSVIALSIISVCAFAKSETVKLEIAGPSAVKPLVITDSAILNLFSIWTGPGVSIDSRRPVGDQPGAFIDWSRGTAARPEMAQSYTVTFHQGGRANMDERHRTYVVTYAFDPKSAQGYIYLPGPIDGEVYARNTFSIVHDVEGNWFHASSAWERSVAPLIWQHFQAN